MKKVGQINLVPLDFKVKSTCTFLHSRLKMHASATIQEERNAYILTKPGLLQIFWANVY